MKFVWQVLLGLVSLALVPAVQAQEKKEKLVVELSFAAKSREQRFNYPNSEPPSFSGTAFESNGTQGSISYRFSDSLGVVIRGGSDFLRAPQFFQGDTRQGERRHPSTEEKGGRGYQADLMLQVALPANLPILGSGTLEAGAAFWQQERRWEERLFPLPSPTDRPAPGDPPSPPPPLIVHVQQRVTGLGPVIGYVRRVRLNQRLELEGRIHGYPRLHQKQEAFEGARSWLFPSTSLSGWKGQAALQYKVASHLWLQTGYHYSRLQAPEPWYSPTWRTSTVHQDRGILGGLTLRF